jgi:pimeloyl-ACP methyl ester carboxylesterase
MTELQTSPECADIMEIESVDLDGQLLRVGIRRGSDASPPLLLFNGIGANLELVEPFVAALDDVTVIIFDVPGVGGSPVPLIPYRFSTLAVLSDKLLTRLGFTGPVDVLGVSWGAATSPGVLMVPARLSVLSKLIGPRRYTDPAYLRQIGAEIYGGAYRQDATLLDAHSRHIQPPRGRGYLYQLLAASGWTSLHWLGALRQTTLVMHGNDDPIVPLANAKILAARIRHASLRVIDDGHLFLITRAAEVAPIVKRFLREEAS